MAPFFFAFLAARFLDCEYDAAAQRWCFADADRRDHLLPDLAARRVAGACRHRIAVHWTMAGDGLHLRFELVVSVCESSSIHIFRIDILAEPKGRRLQRKRARQSIAAFSFGFPNLMDATLFRSLALSFIVCFVALAAIFNIFTLFELWRFIAVLTQARVWLHGIYLFLLPLITVELFPATMLISVLVTYALLARRHEAIAWWASGQSVYRLMLPGLLLRARDGVRIVAGPGVRDARN